MSQDNININVTENIDQVNIVASEIVEVVDLNLYATTEDVTINVTEDIIQVNINKVTSSNVTKTSDLINDGADGTSTYVETDELGAVAFSNDYNDLDNLPTIPEEITKTSDLINDGSDGVNPFITLEDIPAPITIDAVPTDGSSNAVSSNGVFDALATKQNTIGFTPAKQILQVTPVTLTATSWILVSGLYEYTYSNVNILSTSVVDVIPSNSTIAIVQEAGFLPSTLSTSGSVKLYANNLPTADIVVTFNIFN
jgi:hypothetical protein